MAPFLMSRKVQSACLLLMLMSLFAFVSCAKTIKDTEKMMDDLGQDRQLAKDIQFTPSQQDKIKVQF